MGIRAIEEVGERIEAAWAARHLDVRAFPTLACEYLSAASLHREVSVDEIVRWTLESRLPPQFDPKAKFGQPPVTVYRGRQFLMDVLFWVDGTTAIHDHGFSGAFQVLAGSSIETTFEFSSTDEGYGHMQFGRLDVKTASLRRAGDVVPIVAGPAFIHSLFHLDRPSVSLVVRTVWDRKPGMQFRYYPAGLAYDEYFDDETRDRQVQMLHLLREIEHPDLEQVAGRLVRRADLNTIFEVIKVCMRLRDSRVVERLLGLIRNGDAASRFSLWVTAERRNVLLRRARAVVRDAPLRFMLAVLLNCHRRADALALVAEYAPRVEPATQTARWLRQLSETTMRLQVGGMPWEPNVLGIPPFEEGFEEILARALKDHYEPPSERERDFLERLQVVPALAPLFTCGP